MKEIKLRKAQMPLLQKKVS